MADGGKLPEPSRRRPTGAAAKSDRERLVIEAHRLALRAARRRGATLETAEDIAQEVALAIWRRAEPPRALPAYVGSAVRNALTDRYRRRARIVLVERLELSAEDLEDPTGQPLDLALVIDKVKANLSSSERTLLDCLMDGVGYTEIRRILGCPRAAVKKRVHRLRRKIARYLA